jgi:hypothetical protein
LVVHSPLRRPSFRDQECQHRLLTHRLRSHQQSRLRHLRPSPHTCGTVGMRTLGGGLR